MRSAWLPVGTLFLSIVATGPSEAAPRIERVTWRADVEVPRLAIESASVLLPGEPLSPESIRRSVRNLYATELFDRVEVFRKSVDRDAVELTVALWGALRVRSVRLDGAPVWRRASLRRELEVRPGMPLREDAVLRTVYRLGERMADEGFRQATARVSVDLDDSEKWADVTFTLESGPVTRLVGVEVAGDLGPWAQEELKQRLGLSLESKSTVDQLEKAQGRLREFLVESGFGRAEVEVTEQPTGPPSEVVAHFSVRVGPRVELVVLGADQTALMKQGLLPFAEATGWDEASLQRTVDGLRRHLQSQGHHQVTIELVEERSADLWRIEMRVSPGPVFRLISIEFEGLGSVDESEARRRMQTRDRELLGRPGRLVDAQLLSDLENVQAWLARQGWVGVHCAGPVVGREGTDLRVVIPIELGHRLWVSALTLEGFTAAEEAELSRDSALVAGGPYHSLRLEEVVQRARSVLEEGGYPEARIAVDEDWNEAETLVDLTLRSVRGSRSLSDRLMVAGLHRTNRELVRRAVDLPPGQPLSRRTLLDAQRRLYDLGIFSRVRVDLAPSARLEPQTDVRVRVEEGRNRRLLYGLGFDSEDGLGLLLGYSDSNVAGRAVRFQLDARASDRDELYRLILSRPQLGSGQPVAAKLNLFHELDERSSFSVRRSGGLFELGRQWRRDLRTSLFLEFRDVELFDLSTSLSDVDRELRDVQVASLIPSTLR